MERILNKYVRPRIGTKGVGGVEIVRVAIDGSGNYTVSLSGPIDHATALANFEMARQLDPAMPGLLKNLVLEKIELGQAAEANAFLQSVRANRGQEAELEFCFGTCY